MFFASLLTTAIALGQVAHAAPGGPAGGPPGSKGKGVRGKSYNANFDDFTVLPAAIQNVNGYDGLTYNSFSVVEQVLEGVQPHSGNNVAGYGIKGKLLSGTPSLSVANDGQTFDLKSFYYGCAINTIETAVGVPTNCQITVTGWAGSKQKGSQTFAYNGLGGLSAPMMFGKLNSWARGLTKVEFATADATLLGTLFDNIQYTVYSKEKRNTEQA